MACQPDEPDEAGRPGLLTASDSTPVSQLDSPSYLSSTTTTSSSSLFSSSSSIGHDDEHVDPTAPVTVASSPSREEQSILARIRQGMPLTPDDFELIRCLGMGDVGRVYLARLKGCEPAVYFALKTMHKEEIMKRKKVNRVISEQEILRRLVHPFLVRLYGSFQSDELIYFLLEYCAGGELYRILQTQPYRRISEEHARFYASEVLLGLEYLHSLGIVYRDLKPENILLHASGHIMLTDFDLSIMKRSDRPARSYSFVGTTDYLPPEIVKGSGHSFEVDWWTFGVLIFEMVYGTTPFVAPSFDATLSKIRNTKKVTFPATPVLSRELRHLLSALLRPNPAERLGHLRGAVEIRMHPWFASVDFANLLSVQPPLVPRLSGPDDTRYFRKVANEPLPASPARPEREQQSASQSDDEQLQQQPSPAAAAAAASSTSTRRLEKAFREFEELGLSASSDTETVVCKTCGQDVHPLERYHGCHLLSSSSSGYLIKQGHRRKNWRRRWFHVDKDEHVLRYWKKHEPGSKLRGQVRLEEGCVVQALPPDRVPFSKEGVPHCFVLRSPGNPPAYQLVIRAQDDIQRNHWVLLIQDAIKTAQPSVRQSSPN